MEQKKVILLIIPNLNFGGAQRSISKLSFELEKKYRIYLCVFNTDEGIAFPHAGELLNLEVPAGKNIIDKIRRFIERINKLKQYKQTINVDASISFLEGADYINILSRTGREKVIISIRGAKSEDKDIHGVIGWVRKKY